MSVRALEVAAMLGLLVAAVACSAQPADSSPGAGKERTEITRERAIEIARAQVKFEPRETTAERSEQDGRPVWKVTFRGQPPGPGHAMGDYMEVLVDRQSGEIVGLAMS